MKELLINLSLLAIGLFIAMLLCEGMIRVFWPEWAGHQTHQRLFVEYDERLGWRKITNKKGRYITEEYEITEEINSRGLRGH